MRFQILGKTVRVRRSPEPTKMGVNDRVWIDIGEDFCITLQYVLPSGRFDIGVRFDDDEQPFGACFCVPPVGLYVNLQSRPLFKLARRVAELLPSDMGRSYGDRDFSVSIFDWALWWHIGVTRMGSTSKRPKWRDGNFRPLGNNHLQSENLVKEQDVLVPMPERTYRWHAKLYRTTWGFDRLPRFFDRELMRVHLDPHPGEQIPKPGKGENSWDCGEDAIYGSTAPARSIEIAVGDLVGSVMHDRKRHGGSNWRPGEARA